MSRKYLLLACSAGLIVALDQLTKIYIHTQFQLHESKVVIENIFNITYIRNFGAAFGILAQAPSLFREIFFLTMPPVACLIILYILRGVDSRDQRQVLALSSIFGGAVGNYIDRIQFRYVVDFLDFHYYGRYSWPAFNIADMAIVGGVMFLTYLMITEKEVPSTSPKDSLGANMGTTAMTTSIGFESTPGSIPASASSPSTNPLAETSEASAEKKVQE